MPFPEDRLKDTSEASLQETSLSPLPKCSVCGVNLASGTFCNKHQPSTGGNSSGSYAQDTENKDVPSAYDVDYKGEVGRISLKSDLFPHPAKPGQFFSSGNFEHWKFENLEHLTPLQKHEIIENVNKLLTDTHKELANKYDLDYKLEKDRTTGKVIYQLTNKDGSELTPEQQEKIAKDLPSIFNKLSKELTQKLGSNIQLIMVSRVTPKEENFYVNSPFSSTPKPGQGISKNKELEEENQASAYRRPTPLPDKKY